MTVESVAWARAALLDQQIGTVGIAGACIRRARETSRSKAAK